MIIDNNKILLKHLTKTEEKINAINEIHDGINRTRIKIKNKQKFYFVVYYDLLVVSA